MNPNTNYGYPRNSQAIYAQNDYYVTNRNYIMQSNVSNNNHNDHNTTATAASTIANNHTRNPSNNSMTGTLNSPLPPNPNPNNTNTNIMYYPNTVNADTVSSPYGDSSNSNPSHLPPYNDNNNNNSNNNVSSPLYPQSRHVNNYPNNNTVGQGQGQGQGQGNYVQLMIPLNSSSSQSGVPLSSADNGAGNANDNANSVDYHNDHQHNITSYDPYDAMHNKNRTASKELQRMHASSDHINTNMSYITNTEVSKTNNNSPNTHTQSINQPTKDDKGNSSLNQNGTTPTPNGNLAGNGNMPTTSSHNNHPLSHTSNNLYHHAIRRGALNRGIDNNNHNDNNNYYYQQQQQQHYPPVRIHAPNPNDYNPSPYSSPIKTNPNRRMSDPSYSMGLGPIDSPPSIYSSPHPQYPHQSFPSSFQLNGQVHGSPLPGSTAMTSPMYYQSPNNGHGIANSLSDQIHQTPMHTNNLLVSENNPSSLGVAGVGGSGGYNSPINITNGHGTHRYEPGYGSTMTASSRTYNHNSTTAPDRHHHQVHRTSTMTNTTTAKKNKHDIANPNGINLPHHHLYHTNNLNVVNPHDVPDTRNLIMGNGDLYPPFVMLKKPDITIYEIYVEWYYGLNGKEAVYSLNSKGSRWRTRTSADRMFYRKRKTVVDYVILVIRHLKMLYQIHDSESTIPDNLIDESIPFIPSTTVGFGPLRRNSSPGKATHSMNYDKKKKKKNNVNNNHENHYEVSSELAKVYDKLDLGSEWSNILAGTKRIETTRDINYKGLTSENWHSTTISLNKILGNGESRNGNSNVNNNNMNQNHIIGINIISSPENRLIRGILFELQFALRRKNWSWARFANYLLLTKKESIQRDNDFSGPEEILQETIAPSPFSSSASPSSSSYKNNDKRTKKRKYQTDQNVEVGNTGQEQEEEREEDLPLEAPESIKIEANSPHLAIEDQKEQQRQKEPQPQHPNEEVKDKVEEEEQEEYRISKRAKVMIEGNTEFKNDDSTHDVEILTKEDNNEYKKTVASTTPLVVTTITANTANNNNNNSNNNHDNANQEIKKEEQQLTCMKLGVDSILNQSIDTKSMNKIEISYASSASTPSAYSTIHTSSIADTVDAVDEGQERKEGMEGERMHGQKQNLTMTTVEGEDKP